MAGSRDIYWTMTTVSDNTWDLYAIIKGTQVAKRRASRYSQVDGSITCNTYLVPAFYVNSNVSYTGTGTQENPFIIG